MTGTAYGRGLSPRRVCCLAAGWLVFSAWCWAGCEGVPESCREDLARIEQAYRSGLEGAEDAVVRFEVERLRVAALTELVERTYESTLAWVVGREESTQAFERAQGLWLKGMHDALEEASTVEGMRGVAELLLRRLRVFGAMTGDAYCIGEGCH